MNHKHIILCLFMAACLFACTQNDNTSYCPTWLGFTYTTGNYPNYVEGNPKNVVLNPDDSIHITAHQKEYGHLIYHPRYKWTISYDTLDTKNNDDPDDDERVRVDSIYYEELHLTEWIDDLDNPVGHLHLYKKALPPESNKQYTISFQAIYDYGGQGVTIETGSIVNNSYGGLITPQSGPFGGGAQGTLNFTVPN